MTLKELQKIINKAIERAKKASKKGDGNIEIYYGKTELRIDQISQFHIVPDLIIRLKKLEMQE